MHGRVEGVRDRCAVPGCGELGEYKAPLEPANFNGPGSWRFLCLDHVREHNSAYNFFDGMSAEEISAAQNVYGGWERSVRAFSPTAGATPVWSDFADPLDAIAARFLGARARRGLRPPRTAQPLFEARPPLPSRQERRRPQPRNAAGRSHRRLPAAPKGGRLRLTILRLARNRPVLEPRWCSCRG